METKIELGVTGRDKITGFTGVVTGLCYYLSGCNQALLIPKCKEDGSLVSGNWFDFQRIQVLDVEKVCLDNSATPGFDMAPSRNS